MLCTKCFELNSGKKTYFPKENDRTKINFNVFKLNSPTVRLSAYLGFTDLHGIQCNLFNEVGSEYKHGPVYRGSDPELLTVGSGSVSVADPSRMTWVTDPDLFYGLKWSCKLTLKGYRSGT